MPDAKTVVHSDPGILGATPVFVGTRVPVKNLFDYLEAGDSKEFDVLLTGDRNLEFQQNPASLPIAVILRSGDMAPERAVYLSMACRLV